MLFWPDCQKTCWKFFTTILSFAKAMKSVFFSSPENQMIPSGAIWANVGEK